MNLIDNIRSAQSGDARIAVTIARWGVTLYFKPTTARDVHAMNRKYPGMTTPTIAALVDQVIMRAQTETGEQAFTDADRTVLMGEPMAVFDHIGQAIQASTPDGEAVEKN